MTRETYLEKIRACRKCSLYMNQPPLLDELTNCQITWVGLSAKKKQTDDEIPLSPNTNTGLLIQKIENEYPNIVTYKTNLVKCLPLSDEGKLRYPSSSEVDCCFEHLQHEIQVLSPKIVFLLGEKVYSAVGKKLDIKFKKWNGYEYYYTERDGIYYVPIHHPSYIWVYKRGQMQNYIDGVVKIIEQLLS